MGKKKKLKNEERGIILSGSQLYTLYAPVVYSIFLFRNKNIYFEGTCITLKGKYRPPYCSGTGKNGPTTCTTNRPTGGIRYSVFYEIIPFIL